jgi:hypothetical protein
MVDASCNVDASTTAFSSRPHLAPPSRYSISSFKPLQTSSLPSTPSKLKFLKVLKLIIKSY